MEAKLQSLQLKNCLHAQNMYGVNANLDVPVRAHFGGIFMYFLVYFRRCGRVRKKHHCEADEDSTRQRLQRGVSAMQYTY